MEVTALCTVVAFLKVLPNRSQFFQYDSITLSCELQGASSDWRIRRNTSTNTNEECPMSWDRRDRSYCSISDLYPSDSGVYWCESQTGGCCSNSISIAVTAGSVILESPTLPLMVGESVTLRCTNDVTSSINLTNFYKDGLFIGSSSSGDFIIPRVSKSDEGPYMCDVSGAGQSPESWLSVRGTERPDWYATALTLILLPVVVKGFTLLSVNVLMLFCVWRNHKGRPGFVQKK